MVFYFRDYVASVDVIDCVTALVRSPTRDGQHVLSANELASSNPKQLTDLQELAAELPLLIEPCPELVGFASATRARDLKRCMMEASRLISFLFEKRAQRVD